LRHLTVEPNANHIRQVGVRRAALTSFASYAVPVLISLVAMPIVFRTVGASSFGVLSIALLSPGIAISFDFGFTSAAVRRLALELEERGTGLGNALGSYTVALATIGLLLGVAVAAAAPVLVDALGFGAVIGTEAGVELTRLCALWMGLSLALSVPATVLRARQRFGSLTVIQALSTLALWIAAITLAARGGSIRSIVTVALLVTVLSFGVCLVLARREVPRGTRPALDVALLRGDAQFSFGLFIAQLSTAVAFQLDRAIVAALSSPATAGIYALCIGVANKTLFAIGALTSFAYPRVAAMRGQGMAVEIGALLQVLLRVALVLTAPIIIPAVLLSGPFLNLWLGHVDSGAVRMMQLLWVGYAIAAVCAPATHVINGTGTSRLAALFAWVTAILLLSGMYLLIPPLGLPGAGIANVIAMSSAFVFLAIVRRTLKPPPDAKARRLFFGIAAGCAAQFAVLLPLQPLVRGWPSFFLVGAGGLAVYQAVRWALGTLSPEEHRLIQSISMRLRQAGR
jgi:O-antigen/teichoic acid export membrane protein